MSLVKHSILTEILSKFWYLSDDIFFNKCPSSNTAYLLRSSLNSGILVMTYSSTNVPRQTQHTYWDPHQILISEWWHILQQMSLVKHSILTEILIKFWYLSDDIFFNKCPSSNTAYLLRSSLNSGILVMTYSSINVPRQTQHTYWDPQ